MKTIIFKEEFEAKLKKLKVKRRFVRNLRASVETKKNNIELAVNVLNGYDNFELFCIQAFSWGRTSEGVEFWQEISES
jgi:predicted CopG family antitoxin